MIPQGVLDKVCALLERPDVEGFRDTAYPDPGTKGKPWTIGFGTTLIAGAPVMQGMTCTREQAVQFVDHDLQDAYTILMHLVDVPLNENQAAACLDFIYNCGAQNFKTSTLLALINKSDFNNAANEFGKWIHAAGKVLPGLVKRRLAERDLFLTPVSS